MQCRSVNRVWRHRSARPLSVQFSPNRRILPAAVSSLVPGRKHVSPQRYMSFRWVIRLGKNEFAVFPRQHASQKTQIPVWSPLFHSDLGSWAGVAGRFVFDNRAGRGDIWTKTVRCWTAKASWEADRVPAGLWNWSIEPIILSWKCQERARGEGERSEVYFWKGESFGSRTGGRSRGVSGGGRRNRGEKTPDASDGKRADHPKRLRYGE